MDHEPVNSGDALAPGAYERIYGEWVERGVSPLDAASFVAEAYLDGKPASRGKHKITGGMRDAAFWKGSWLAELPAQAWRCEPMGLALARYLRQERISNPDLIARIASHAPDTLQLAVRRSEIVLRQESERWQEVKAIAGRMPEAFGDLLTVFEVFGLAYRERVDLVQQCRKPLARLSPLELLVYVSLHAFEILVPLELSSEAAAADPDERAQAVWDAVNDILVWKLAQAHEAAFSLTDADIGRSLAVHLSPFLFPSPLGHPPRHDLRAAFANLLAAQIELNSFKSRSAEAYCYHDEIQFELRSGVLEIVDVDPESRARWVRNGERLDRLHLYWFYRALDAFAASPLATAVIGLPENAEANRLAYIKAMRTELRLQEIYGLDDTVTAPTGLCVSLFQALLSLELMSAFYERDFLRPYMSNLNRTGHWAPALGQLAFAGLTGSSSENRFPVTWSERSAKIARIVGWTVTEEFPQGDLRAAEAILDFWTSDWAALARQVREQPKLLVPNLLERPVLKLGRYLFELPWVVAMQNNSTAAINNLRRLGARRGEARDETRRIELRLAQRFEARGFRVVANYQPACVGDDDPGEVDLVCAGDDVVLVMEVKSTFVRSSTKDAWMHATNTLRKAGRQLRRKLAAVERALASDPALSQALGLEGAAQRSVLRAWIVDTSIEYDHRRFAGFLKVSVEEVLIALRDDRHLLDDPAGLMRGGFASGKGGELNAVREPVTLYPEGFTAMRFVEVVESEAVWTPREAA